MLSLFARQCVLWTSSRDKLTGQVDSSFNWCAIKVTLIEVAAASHHAPSAPSRSTQRSRCCVVSSVSLHPLGSPPKLSAQPNSISHLFVIVVKHVLGVPGLRLLCSLIPPASPSSQPRHRSRRRLAGRSVRRPSSSPVKEVVAFERGVVLRQLTFLVLPRYMYTSSPLSISFLALHTH